MWTYGEESVPTVTDCTGQVQLLLTFSMLNFSKAWVAKSTASCCISSFMSAFLMTAFRSDILLFALDGLLAACANNLGRLLLLGDLRTTNGGFVKIPGQAIFAGIV